MKEAKHESTISEIFSEIFIKIFKLFMEILTEIFIANSVTQLSLKMREVKDKSTILLFLTLKYIHFDIVLV